MNIVDDVLVPYLLFVCCLLCCFFCDSKSVSEWWILDVSTKLFFEKGYEQTSLQDIIDGLGGMTKGAVYHHFRSKEEILIKVVERMSEESDIAMARIRDDVSLTGKQKLEKMFSDSITNTKQKDMLTVTPNLLENPKLLVYYLKMVAYTVVPDKITPSKKETTIFLLDLNKYAIFLIFFKFSPYFL